MKFAYEGHTAKTQFNADTDAILAYADEKGGMTVIYAETVIPEGARLITVGEFHGRC